jgi:SAM-dependent methyltransferase
MRPNVYSEKWFEFFHRDITPARTSLETDFVCNCAPLPDFKKILDVCCGSGRHARALSARGYSVVGIDRDGDAIARARELDQSITYIEADVRNHQPTPQTFDAVIVMGQSFGHFDDAMNRDVLLRLANAVRAKGRVILDLWNPDFFEEHQGERDLRTSRGIVRENKRVDRDRLLVRLDYPDGATENFEWQLFSATQMQKIAEPAGLIVSVSCCGFDQTKRDSSEPRIQFVLERSSL